MKYWSVRCTICFQKLSEVLNVFSTYKLERPQKESTSRSTSRAPAILYEVMYYTSYPRMQPIFGVQTGNDANGIKLEYEEHKLMTDENENNEIMYQKLDIEINVSSQFRKVITKCGQPPKTQSQYNLN